MENVMKKIVSLICVLFVLFACLTSCEQIEIIKGNITEIIGGKEDPDIKEDSDVEEDPDGSEDQSDPENSENPENPENTDNPDNPGNTENPENNDTPQTPSEPSDPTEPSDPVTPDGPTNPDVPSDPDTPNEPVTPDEPITPDEPAVSVTVSKTANEMAASIGKGNNADIVSGKSIALDSNISVSFSKGSANTEPALYSGAIRVYQNGGTVTITAKSGAYLDKVKITCASSMTGSGKLIVEGGSKPSLNNDILTINVDKNATELTIKTGGSSKSERLYVAAIEVTYTKSASGGGEPDDPTVPDSPADSDYAHTDFTASEKEIYDEYIGFVIPFLPTDEYEIEAYEEDGYRGVYFSAVCNSESEFEEYLELFSSYVNDGTETDEYGYLWYLYSNLGIYVDVCYYEYDGTYYVDVDAYYETEGGSGGDQGGTGSGSQGGTTDSNIITNEGAGLPTDSGSGIYNVDFTDAKNVKDVTDQAYYAGGCPTVGSPGVLVIPVEFSDVTAASKGYSVDKIVNAFAKNGTTDYYSVYDYYYISSYGQLELDITVLDNWFRPSRTSSYYESQTMDYYGNKIEIGDQMIIDEALKYLEPLMDLSQFDSDNNGTIDSIVLVTTLDIDYEVTFYWAYRYWNMYTDSNDEYYEYDGVYANDYLWAPYKFLHETYDDEGNAIYTDTTVMNTYTFIHEFGHILGADDYYDTAYVGSPMGGCDMMDAMTGDHNAYTKFNYGWLTTARLVVTSGSVTLTLKDFSKNGDTVIIANNWNPELGAYQEYYIVVYYTGSGLNGDGYGYFARDGIIVYHVNASLCYETDDGEIYYFVYNTNTDPSDEDYGTEDNLIEFVKSPAGNYTYVAGDTLGAVKDDQGNDLGYTFTVDSIVGDTATLTFTKK